MALTNSVIAKHVIELSCKITQRLRCIAPFGRQRTLEIGTCRLRTEFGRKCRTARMIDCQGGGHEIAPDLRRYRPAADLSQRLVVVAANPHANDKVARKAD